MLEQLFCVPSVHDVMVVATQNDYKCSMLEQFQDTKLLRP